MSSGKRVSAFSKRAQKDTAKSRPKPKRDPLQEATRDNTLQDDLDFIQTIVDPPPAAAIDLTTTATFDDQPPLRKAVLPIELTPSQLRPVLYRVVTKKHGLNMKSSGLEKLAEFMGRRFGVDWRGAKGEKFMDNIAKTWKAQDRGLFIDGDQLQVVIREVIDVEDGQSRPGSSTTMTSGGVPKQQTLMGFAPENGPDVDALQETSDNTLESHQEIDWRNYYKVVNATDQPPYRFNPQRKHFELAKTAPSVLAPASSRTSQFATRYHISLASTHRQDTFQAPTFLGRLIGTGKRDTNTQAITMIKSLLGREGQGFILFGLISKGANGRFWLQDSSGTIELDIESHAIPAQGSYYAPGSLVICDGIYSREKFIVTTIGTPTSEFRRVARNAYGYLDFLGMYSPENSKSTGPIRVDRLLDKKLVDHERANLTSHRFIILGCDIFLDKMATIDALQKVLTRIQAEIQIDSLTPVCIVFPGSFVSSPFQPNGSSSLYKDCFDALAVVLKDFPSLISSAEFNVTFLFVPGDNDPWASTFSSGASPAWPAKPIPPIFTNRLRRAVPGAEFATNPTRVGYMSQEILVVRDDLGARFRRNQIIFPELERRKAGIYDEEEAAEEEDFDKMVMEELEGKNNEKNNDSSDDEGLETVMHDLTFDEKAARQAARSKRVQNMLSGPNRPVQEQLHVDPDVAEARKIVKTILDQGHLSPFPLSVRPVSWDLDYTLSLSPAPSVLVLADPSSPPFKVTYQGCHVLNPGAFLRDGQAHWVEYVPSTRAFTTKSMYV